MAALIFAALRLLMLVIIADAILSWVQPPQAFPRSITRQLTEPLYAPIHSVISPQMTGGVDLSPIIVIVLLNLVTRALARGLGG